MRKVWLLIGAIAVSTTIAQSVSAKDLGDVLLKKGLITEDELRQAREEEKQKAAAEESRRDAIAAKLPKWLDAITLFGDLRTRHEGFYEDGLIARNRFRFRGRIGLTANITDELAGTFRLTTGDPNDPISTNQTFQNTFTRKPVNFDWAYLTLKPGKTLNIEPGLVAVYLGKFGVNSYRVSELVWDDDVSPEGATEVINLIQQREGFLRNLRLNGFQWVVDEISNAEDPWMAGGQVVVDTALGNVATWSVALADYHYEKLDRVAKKLLAPNTFAVDPTTGNVVRTANASFNSSLANSNNLAKDSLGNVLGFQSGFNLLNVSTEFNVTDVAGVPAGGFLDYVYNTLADTRNEGFYVGAGVGKAGRDWYRNSLKVPGDWGLSYTFAWVEKEATLSLFSYSDINEYVQAKATQRGSTNVIAHIPRFDYMLLPNLQFTAKAHLINALDRKNSNAALVGNPTLFRTQLDLVLKF